MANSPPISTPNVTLLTSSFPFSLHLTEYPCSTFPLLSPLNILNNGHFGAGVIKPEARRSVSVSDPLLEPQMPNVRMTTVTLPKTTWMCFPAHTQVSFSLWNIPHLFWNSKVYNYKKYFRKWALFDCMIKRQFSIRLRLNYI